MTRPRSGSQVERLIAEIRKAGTIRTAELAKASGVDSKLINGLLAKPVESGELTACTVRKPGERAVREYRIGPGVASRLADFVPLGSSRRALAIVTRPATAAPAAPRKAAAEKTIIRPFAAPPGEAPAVGVTLDERGVTFQSGSTSTTVLANDLRHIAAMLGRVAQVLENGGTEKLSYHIRKGA